MGPQLIVLQLGTFARLSPIQRRRWIGSLSSKVVVLVHRHIPYVHPCEPLTNRQLRLKVHPRRSLSHRDDD